MLHPKSIHFPSGYPIARSPPLFVCSSPGPDPYRSLDNVYEELGPPRDSDAESEPQPQSDDDFAEDELSVGGCIVVDGVATVSTAATNKSLPMTTTDSTISHTIPSISTIYNECTGAGSAVPAMLERSEDDMTCQMQVNSEMNSKMQVNGSNDRNSLLSSSSASTAPANDRAAIVGSHSSSSNSSSCSSGPTRIASPDSGLALRNRSRMRNFSVDKLNAGSGSGNGGGGGGAGIDRSNERILLTLPYNHQHHHHHSHHPYQHTHNPYQQHNNNNHTNNNNLDVGNSHSSDSISNHLNLDVSNSHSDSISNHLNSVNNNVNGCIVERHNQINKQLSSESSSRGAPLSSSVSTIFPGRLINHQTASPSPSANPNYRHHHHHHQNQYYASVDDNSIRCSNYGSRSRTNPRSSSNRQRYDNSMPPLPTYTDSTYSYADPELFDPPILAGYRTMISMPPHANRQPHLYPAYVLPDYQECSDAHERQRNNQRTSRAAGQPIYSHDSSFGSDSGYSQYTSQNSRSKSSGSNNSGNTNGTNGSGSGSASALATVFGWTRRKDGSAGKKSIGDKSTLRTT